MTDQRALALDIGTSSLRALVVDAHGDPAGPAVRVEYSGETSNAAAEVFHPHDLLDRTARAIDQIGPVDVQAVGVSCFWHSMMGVDDRLEPVTDLLSWAFTAADAQALALAERLDAAAVHARTGARLHSSFWPAKLLWLAEEHPEQFRRARWWAGFAEWMFARLFEGHPIAGTAMASGTGLMRLSAPMWDAELLQAAAVRPDHLPDVSDEPWTGLAPAYARRWPHLADVPWVPPFGDGACSNIGVGAFGADRAALNVGTSAALRVAWEGEPVAVPPGLWCYRLNGRRLVMGGALSNAGNLHRWLTAALQLPDDAEQQIAARPADCHGLTVLPLLAGERSPGYAADATGAIIGLRHATTPVDVLQAGMESVALRCRAVWDQLIAAHPGVAAVVASGGGMDSALWRQMMADALEQRVIASAEIQTSARGAGLLALEAIGAPVDLRRARTGTVHEPDVASASALSAARQRQDQLYDLLIPPKGAVRA